MTREKHLELIQGVINRMAGNSFQLKGWSVTLVSALLALAANDGRAHFVLVAYFPTIAFWVLDGYFLCQERLFRELYKAVCDQSGDDSNFSMDTSKYKDKVASWLGVCFSRTLFIFHGMILVVVIIATELAFALAS
jgi:hypothetical protein